MLSPRAENIGITPFQQKYQMTTANLLPAIVKYRDFHNWASIVEKAGEAMRELELTFICFS
jgi:hypothetical protein